MRVSERVARKLLVKKVPASYPADARRNLIQGDVELKVLIDTNGAVKDVALLSGPAALAPGAIEAVKQWKYKPYLLNGQPVEMETKVTVSFELSLQ
jgi:protein TonB